MNLLLITHEFTYHSFSGNGILARSIVKSLLQCNNDNIHITVWCCRPPSTTITTNPDTTHDETESNNNDTSHNNTHLHVPEITNEQYNRLYIISNELQSINGWYRLDRQCAYESFVYDQLNSSQQQKQLCHILQNIDTIGIIDWTGWYAYQSIPNHLRNNSTTKILYFNFRVYSSGIIDQTEHEWYDNMEYQPLNNANIIIALSNHDQKSLYNILNNKNNNQTTTITMKHNNNNENQHQQESISESSLLNDTTQSEKVIHILHPPLRGDIQQFVQRYLMSSNHVSINSTTTTSNNNEINNNNNNTDNNTCSNDADDDRDNIDNIDKDDTDTNNDIDHFLPNVISQNPLFQLYSRYDDYHNMIEHVNKNKIRKRKCLITCFVRISPEKNTIRFIHKSFNQSKI